MRAAFLSILIIIAGLLLVRPSVCFPHPHIIDANRGEEIAPADLLDDLRRAQVVFVGELHDQPGHHRAQLAIIDALDGYREQPLAIGLEMFRRDSQETLDLWTSGQLPLLSFLEVYNDNWSMWHAYWTIFLHARTNNLKMVGLNIPRSLTAKVARSGFDSLSQEERALLGNVQCVVDPAYEGFIRQALGVHGEDGLAYQHFCEAQMLWDTMMARNLVDFLKENSDFRVVVLAGSGHAWKYGIPTKMLELADISYRVVLPEVPGRLDRRSVRKEITDYLWLDEGAEGWALPR